MTAEELATALEKNFSATIHLLGRKLRDFGYAVDDGYVEAEVKRLQSGEAPRGGPSLFLARWLKEGME